MAREELEIRDDPSEAELRFVEDRINAFNVARTGFRDGRRLAVFLRDASGALRAGLTGHTWGGCCEVRFLWVREAERGRGLGRRLLAAAEAEAVARGCDRLVVSSHSFQAPDFYRAQGYTIVGRAEGYPRGHAQVYLQKRLGQGG